MKHQRRPSTWLLVVLVVSSGIAAGAGWHFWWVFVTIAFAIVVNGLFATLEDDLPGGFNNPDGNATPKYAIVAGWALRGVGLLLGGASLAMLGLHFFGSR